jgi:negative regulator of genetic competence, sporulation and motility
MGRSLSPTRVKSVIEFPNPHKLSTVIDPIEEHRKMLKDLTKNKERTEGLFLEAIDEIRHPG